jgi:hypothetical protein
MTFIAALCDCALHGELTEAQARAWLDGEDLALALRIIATPHLHRPRDPDRAWAGCREALSWALDMLDLYDERLARIDGRERVYSPSHLAAKEKARSALDLLVPPGED